MLKKLWPRRLFAKLYLSMAVATVLMITAVIMLSDYAERRVSIISGENQTILKGYAQEAATLFKENNDEIIRQRVLQSWIDDLQKQENTWAAILKTDPYWLAGSYDEEVYYGEKDLTSGRNMKYPIHLYYSYNPILKIPMEGTGYNLMIQLPQRLRPGVWWQELNSLIRYGLPVLLVALLALLIYRHIVAPLKVLQDVTRRFSDGEYDVRTQALLSGRKDEIGDLGSGFDHMADRIGLLMKRQHQLIQDISHELRTPVTRIRLVLEGNEPATALQRINHEINGMQSLLEDTLTLSWLDNETLLNRKTLTTETLDVCLLIEAIADDARFEFPEHSLELYLPETCILNNSNHRALGQALENIIRNALKYSPENTSVIVVLSQKSGRTTITVSDQGPGVDPEYLEDIFEPFFRVDKSRRQQSENSSGYGLGLALSRRQIQALGGTVTARLNHPGLVFEIIL